ncbi:MAG: hypothetical protein HQK95_07070 [Nitrospirae bacterium]|nr:hypothetical protein [Nitrospirota bacterium]
MTRRDKDDNNLSNYRLLMMENKFAVHINHYPAPGQEIFPDIIRTAVHGTARRIRQSSFFPPP